ncbi:hypothetical protein SK128_011131, partial [Halocaridina rubra]
VTSLRHRPNNHYTPTLTYTLLEELWLHIIERCWSDDPVLRPSSPAVSDHLIALYLSSIS